MTRYQQVPQAVLDRHEVRRRQRQRAKYVGQELVDKINVKLEPQIRHAVSDEVALQVVRDFRATLAEWNRKTDRALRLWPEDLTQRCMGDAGELGDLALVAEDWRSAEDWREE